MLVQQRDNTAAPEVSVKLLDINKKLGRQNLFLARSMLVILPELKFLVPDIIPRVNVS
jgi:hypothetical protein